MNRTVRTIGIFMLTMSMCTIAVADKRQQRGALNVSYDTESVLKYLKSEEEKKSKKDSEKNIKPVPPSS